METEPERTLAGNTDTSLLKVLALVAMLCDHMGAVLFPGVFELRIIGRMALPLYAWCLVVGCVKTRDPLRYGLRLLGLALLSQPLYMMALNHTWADFSILFTLLISLAALVGIRKKWYLSQFWAPALCYLLLGVIKADYGWRGLTFVLVLYFARETKGGLAAAYMAYALFWGSASSAITTLFGAPIPLLELGGLGVVFSALFRLQAMIWLSLPLILINTHSGLRMPKWLGYGLYPLHLALLIVLRLLSGTPLGAMLQRL